MSVDFNAIATAVAVRFGPTIVTAPSGETNIQLATAELPDAIVMEPTVLVFPPDVTLGYGPSLRKGMAKFPVRFYIYQVRDNPRNAVLINKWLSALYVALDAKVQLDLPTYVTGSDIGAITPGILKYADIDYHGIELTVDVRFGEGVNYTA